MFLFLLSFPLHVYVRSYMNLKDKEQAKAGCYLGGPVKYSHRLHSLSCVTNFYTWLTLKFVVYHWLFQVNVN